MGGNWASHRVLAMKSTSSVILVMSWWVLRAGSVRRAWPGAASRRLAEVSVQHRYLSARVTSSLHLTKSPMNDRCVPLCYTGVKITAQLHLLCALQFQFKYRSLLWPFSLALYQSDINECASSPCLNGGTCVDEVNQFSCVCSKGWSGPTCQTPLPTCKQHIHNHTV